MTVQLPPAERFPVQVSAIMVKFEPGLASWAPEHPVASALPVLFRVKIAVEVEPTASDPKS